MELLRRAYFANTSSIDAIRRGNIGLWSAEGIIYGLIKTAVLQTNANNRGIDPYKHKNTYLLRSERSKNMDSS